MEELIINNLAKESVKRMINPVIFMHPQDFKDFVKICEISLNGNTTYKEFKVSCDINIKIGLFYITDFITELIP